MSNLITPKGGWAGDELRNTKADETLFCPNCRAEFRPGFTTCSDCQIDLVQRQLLPSAKGFCPNCGAVAESGTQECLGCGHIFGLLNLSAPRQRPEALAGLKCVQHPEVDVVVKCRGCSKGVCSTCDFQLPGGLHFCPSCIENAGNEQVSPQRRKRAIIAIVIAVYGTIVGGLTFSGVVFQSMAEGGNEQQLGLFVTYFVYFPALIGTALALSSFERRLRNTSLIWTALIWNCILTGIFLILEIIGQVFL